MKLVFLTVLTSFFFGLTAQSQSWLWTQRITDSLINQFSDNSNQTKVAVSLTETDGQENIIVANGILFRKLPPVVDKHVIRIAKYDKNAKKIWVKYFENPSLSN